MKCPHCLVSFHDVWTQWFYEVKGERQSNYEASHAYFAFRTTVCPACKQIICSVVRTTYPTGNRKIEIITTYPKATARPVPSQVPSNFANDFSEACLVIGDSEKASAALSRRCFQKLLIEKAGAKEKAKLDSQIEEVLNSGTLPSHLAKAIDGVRVVGNIAVHPIKNTCTGEVIEVEPGEAEWLLDTLEGLFDFYFVQPAILERKIDALNKKLKEAGKPMLKDTKPV